MLREQLKISRLSHFDKLRVKDYFLMHYAFEKDHCQRVGYESDPESLCWTRQCESTPVENEERHWQRDYRRICSLIHAHGQIANHLCIGNDRIRQRNQQLHAIIVIQGGEIIALCSETEPRFLYWRVDRGKLLTKK